MTVTNGPFRRVYRYSGRWLWVALAPALLGTVGLVYRIGVDDDIGGPLLAFGVAVLFVAVFVYVGMLVHRTATIVDDDHLTVGGLHRSHPIDWRDVQGIEIEPTYGNPPMMQAVVYDDEGKKRPLPHVNARSVGNLDAEVEELRRLWTERRGEDWKLASRGGARLEQDRRFPTPAWVRAMTAAISVFVFDIVLFFILLANDAYADRDSFASTYLGSATLTMILPATAYVGTLVVVTLHRRRAMS